jgi:PHD/YefM family antitoxin component YafN of YafNO toxin-antitoxin module
MPDDTEDTHSLTSFCRRSGDFIKQLTKSKRPIMLTVKGKPALVVLDADAYQRLLDIAARADAEEGIRQRLDDVAHGRSRPAREVFSRFKGLKEPKVLKTIGKESQRKGTDGVTSRQIDQVIRAHRKTKKKRSKDSIPEWLRKSWESAKRQGLDRLSMEEINAEIDSARKTRRARQQPSGE